MKIKKVWLTLLLPALFHLSCNKFLDVKADNQIVQEDLFKNGEGFRIAVNGVYRTLGETDLYGRNLSWGFVSGMGGNYQLNTSLPQEVRYGADFEWEFDVVIKATEQIWSRAYNVIANVNNIIQKVEGKDSSFFEYGGMEKDLILGEMYGLRALMHFDLARLFSPAPVTGYKGASIPYVTKYPDHQPVHKNLDEVFTGIVNDIEKSRSLLVPYDTSSNWLRAITTSLAGRIRQTGTWLNTRFPEFFQYRAERLSYFAATALLARVHLYNQNYEKAYANAKIIYDYQKRNFYRWTTSSFQGQVADVDYIYTKRPEELLLTFSNNRNYDNYEATISGSSSAAFRMNAMDLLFTGDLDDFRRVGWYNRYSDQRYLTWSRPKGTSANATSVIQNQGRLLPVIRFSEVYHILIECLNKEGKTEDAVKILNDLRTNRGAKVKISSTISALDLMEVLVKDIIRETLTEGQTFYMFKRLNRNIFYGATDRIMNPEDWVAPIPPSENAYQL